MAEIEGIMNSRPLTVETSSDVTSYKQLFPSDLLTMKWKVVPAPAGKFQKEDLYSRKYWRRVHYLASEFWCRWWKEILLSLQECQKYHLQKWNFMFGNIVLLKVDAHWNNWSMAKIIHVCPDKNGVLQNVQLLVGSCNGTKTVLDRPIQKIVLLVEAEEGLIPQWGD